MPAKRAQSAFAAAECRRLLRERTGRSRALLAGRGAAAILATLRALDLHDREILLPANTCYVVLWAVLQSGNTPRLVDVDALTGNVSAETLAACGVERPAALIPAHMYGLPASMSSIVAWAKTRGAFVLEDAALALGSTVEGRPAGAWGDAALFSFGPGKIGDAGLGGALVTDDDRLAAEVERLLADMPLYTEATGTLNRQWLDLYWPLHQFETETPGVAALYPTLFALYGGITRYRLPDAAARDLLHALKRLGNEIAHRAELARLYDEQLAGLPMQLFSRTDETVLWRYPLRVAADLRDPLLRSLWGAGLFDATRWYPSLQPMLAALAPDVVAPPTPEADRLSAEIVNLPLSPETARVDAERVAAQVRAFFDG